MSAKVTYLHPARARFGVTGLQRIRREVDFLDGMMTDVSSWGNPRLEREAKAAQAQLTAYVDAASQINMAGLPAVMWLAGRCALKLQVYRSILEERGRG